MATIFTESFETDGNGTRYTTSVPEFSDGSGDFFTRTDGSNISGGYNVTGANGSFYFAAQDIDGEGAASQQTLTFSGIDISNFTNLSFSALFAEDDASDGDEDWDLSDFVRVSYQIDGGSFQNLLAIESVPDGDAFNAVPAVDTDCDGDGDGSQITSTFTELGNAIAETGSTLDLRITFDLDSGDEDIAIDLVQVTGETATAEPVLNETFDDSNQFVTSTPFFSDGSGDYFGISDGAGGGDIGGDPVPNVKDYTGFDGSFLIGQDLDGEGATLPITLTWSGLDISGLSNLEFSGDAEFFDDPGDIDAANDSILVEYQIDGGGYQSLIAFEGADFSSSTFNGIFREDTNFDGTGDGAALGDEAQTFTKAIAGTGSTLALRLSVSVNAGDEDFGIDNFVIAEAADETSRFAIAATDADKAEGDAGTTPFTFTVTRSGDTSSFASVDFAVSSAEADAADFGGTLPSGTVNFAADETSQVISINVSGDTDAEPDESFTVTLSNPSDSATITAATADGTIQNDDGVAITLISDIQGSGDASPIEGQEVTIEAVVVGDFQDGDQAEGELNGDLNGFFVQEENADVDTNPATSEGLFIFDGSSPAVDVKEGDVVRVTGTVQERFEQTQLAATGIEVVSSGNPLPTPAIVNFPVDDVNNLEAFEGMQIKIPDTLFVTEYFNLDRFGEVVLSSDGESNQPGTDGRLDQYTQFNDPDQAGFAAY